MKSSETLPQPEPGDSKPIGAVPFEVVRQAEFVFDPFMGSLIQLPAIRMQRAQSSEFFLPQSSLQPGKADVEEALVWERPLPQISAPAIPTAEEPHPAVPTVTRKAKSKKAAKEQEAPRFYQPPTVRFFDPLAAAAAEDGEGAEELELPGPRASTQLSPELKAAILRIDEQRRQMQQDEKPAKEKKRGFLKTKPVGRADVHDVLMEIVKPRDVVLTERAARWEEIAAPPPRLAEPEVPAQPEVLVESHVQPAAEAGPPPELATPVAADTEQVAAIGPVSAPIPEESPMPATVPVHAFEATPEAVELYEEIPITARVPPPDAAQPTEIIAAFAPEAAVPEEVVSAPEFVSPYESVREPEIVPVQEVAATPDAIPIETPAAPPLAAQPLEIIPAIPQEAAAAEEIVFASEFDSPYESLRELEIVRVQEVASTPDAIPIDTPVAPLPAAQAPEIIPAIPQEAATAEEIVATPELVSPYESLREQEIVLLHEAASTYNALPIDEQVATPMSASTEETIPSEQEDFAAEEIVPTLQFSLSDEDLWETELAAMPGAPAPATPPPFIAPTVEPETISLHAAAPLKQPAPLPPAFAADESTTPLVEVEPVESSSTKRFRGITDAIARGKRAEPVMEPIEPAIPDIPLEEPFENEAERARKKKEKLPLGTRLQRWLGGEARLDGNRRRADRMSSPGLVAFYWSGGSPRPHEIVNISKTGFYLKTKEFWSIETLVRMTLQRPPSETKRKAESISVLARVVRIDEDGVGHEFVTTEALKHAHSMDVMPSQGTDTRALDKFLQIK